MKSDFILSGATSSVLLDKNAWVVLRSFNVLRLFFHVFKMNCRFQRPPGAIPSSMLGLEALTGTLDDFGFEDYLNGK